MRILIIPAPYKQVPPLGKGYGGVELVCFWLVRELIKRGHEITTMCVPGSTVPGRKIIWDPRDLPENAGQREPIFGQWFQGLMESFRAMGTRTWEIVHDHTHLKFPSAYCHRVGFPYLNTVHLPNPPFSGNAVALSEGHKTTVSPTAKVIHLGVPAEDYPFENEKGDYALYLGYMAPHKGVHLAIQAAKELDIKLILAGPYEVFPDYFEQQIKPELDEKRTWVGEVSGQQKLDLLSKARFIVLPIQWEEPGSTVCFEALATGTPTIGFKRGALRDIIINPKIGTLAENYEELVEAMRNPPTDYKACRDYVIENYDIPSRIEKYEELYQAVLNGARW